MGDDSARQARAPPARRRARPRSHSRGRGRRVLVQPRTKGILGGAGCGRYIRRPGGAFPPRRLARSCIRAPASRPVRARGRWRRRERRARARTRAPLFARLEAATVATVRLARAVCGWGRAAMGREGGGVSAPRGGAAGARARALAQGRRRHRPLPLRTTRNAPVGIGVVSSMRPIFMPARASARSADCAPGPGCLVLLPPVPRILMCSAVMPISLQRSATSCAASMAA